MDEQLIDVVQVTVATEENVNRETEVKEEEGPKKFILVLTALLIVVLGAVAISIVVRIV